MAPPPDCYRYRRGPVFSGHDYTSISLLGSDKREGPGFLYLYIYGGGWAIQKWLIVIGGGAEMLNVPKKTPILRSKGFRKT
jgi:hypothetical protein